ncbi:MAG: hypothetical protein M0R74_05210 [Dehalococcoidia bacterium]|nr:hypothetical protein [Dehalococcoidia bacterium]
MFYELRQSYEPRASLIPVARRLTLPTELWMGGANALHGELLEPGRLADTWIIDLAGDLPDTHREAAGLWLPRVFTDSETEPSNFDRLCDLAESVAAALTGAPAVPGWPHPSEPPSRLYVMCQQGLNRSGLVTGLILRALGHSVEETLAAIATRRGALNNQTYVRLLRGEAPTR